MLELKWYKSVIISQRKQIRKEIFNKICFSPDIMDYLNRLREPVEQLQVRMQKTQHNLNEIRRIASTWVKYPLFERKDGKKDTVLCLNERGNRVAKRYAEISAASDTVHRFTIYPK